ncbi:MAG: class I SAM-dependent methyltransferase [Pseudomonadaceae bacterium]|nr:class I SAM-dependent methyltransferase [Pseudomonadaceae bacterium]
MKLWLDEHDPERISDIEDRYRNVVCLVENRPEVANHAFYLRARDGHIELSRGDDERGVWIDEQELNRRREGRSDLMRALGDVRDRSVLDATAGFGVDAAQIAFHGARVTAMEREPGIYCLLDDLARRASHGFEAVFDDSREQLGKRWDIIYLDPMFPQRNKRALPAKRLQYLATLAEYAADPDSLAGWLADCRRACDRRTVLKRRAKDPVLAKPAGCIKGRSVRFDIYTPLR